MSLEAALAANTAAVEKLTAILQSRAASAEAPAAEAPRRGRPPKQDALASLGGNAGSDAAPALSLAAPVAAPVVSSVVNIKELADRFIKLAETQGEGVARSLLKKYGAARLSEVKAELYPQFSAELTGMLLPAPVAAAPAPGLL